MSLQKMESYRGGAQKRTQESLKWNVLGRAKMSDIYFRLEGLRRNIDTMQIRDKRATLERIIEEIDDSYKISIRYDYEEDRD